jgi:hypothetical protein
MTSETKALFDVLRQSADPQAAAATAQFVRRRLTYSTKMAEQTAKR